MVDSFEYETASEPRMSIASVVRLTRISYILWISPTYNVTRTILS